MDNLDTREWLLTNGLGSFASGTVCDARTRTYHGWLIAALDPPSQRTLLLSYLDASLEVAGQIFALSTNFWTGGKVDPLGYQLLRSFEIEPVPTWVWGESNWQLVRQLVMPYGSIKQEESGNRILIQYRYEGDTAATLRLRPVIGDRNFHHQQSAASELHFSQLVAQQQICLQAMRPDWTGTPWHLRWSAGDYKQEGVWYWHYYYPEEKQRGLADTEDLYSPGYLTVTLQPGDAIALEAKVGLPHPDQPDLSPLDFQQEVQTQEQRLYQWPSCQVETLLESSNLPTPTDKGQSPIFQQLLRAGDQFIVYRASIAGPTVIAGYHWFNDWGRDTLIALPGLALATGRYAVAKGLLETFGRSCRNGLIPNAFPDAGAQPFYNSIDAALWWIETLGLYLEATQDWEFLAQQYPVVRQIYKGFMAGTDYNIRIDAADGLVTWDFPGVALTWMDAVIDGQPVTPRCGKPVEINALWYSALCWASRWAQQLLSEPGANVETRNFASLQNQRNRYTRQAQQVKASLQKFWNPGRGYFYDRIAPDDVPDPKIRPNAVLALSLYHCGFPAAQGRSVLKVASRRLLTPYGLRSLERDDPEYVGTYAGNSHYRDRAYHQGTVWSWLIGPFIRAWSRFYDSEPVPFDCQPMLKHFQQQACLGSISEIFDGDPPYAAQGAIAQAWSVAELIRHYQDLGRQGKGE